VNNNNGRHITLLNYINYEKKVKTVMANNSSNIKKNPNNCPSSYMSHSTQKKTTTYNFENPGLGLGQTHKC